MRAFEDVVFTLRTAGEFMFTSWPALRAHGVSRPRGAAASLPFGALARVLSEQPQQGTAMTNQGTGIARDHPSASCRRIGAYAGLIAALIVLWCAPGGSANAGKPIIDESYANGEVVYMIGPHLITNPNPKQYAQSEELYIVAYPINEHPGTDTTPKSLPASGYQPQCNPCYHFGPPSQGDTFAYHDHILSGSPGFGNQGTAGVFKGPWKIILLKYKESVLSDPNFTPAKSAAELDAREAAGMFQELIPGAENPYEIPLPVILICPLVSPNA